MESKLVYLHDLRSDGWKPPCRFPEGEYEWIHTVDGIPIAVSLSKNQVAADFHGSVCRLLFWSVRPNQVYVEGVFFARGSAAYQTLLSEYPYVEAEREQEYGIVLPVHEDDIERLNVFYVSRFQDFLKRIQSGKTRLIQDEDGPASEDPSDAMYVRHLLYESMIIGGNFVNLYQGWQYGNQIPIGTDVTQLILTELAAVPIPAHTWYTPPAQNEIPVFVNRCPRCGNQRIVAKLSPEGSVSRMTTGEYMMALKWLRAPSQNRDLPFRRFVATHDACGQCELDD